MAEAEMKGTGKATTVEMLTGWGPGSEGEAATI